MLRCPNRTSDGYSRKDIFTMKLRNEPFDVLRKNFAKDLDDWMINCEIFERIYEFSNSRYTYRCKYPTRIWYTSGKGEHEITTCDHLMPGEIWTF